MKEAGMGEPGTQQTSDGRTEISLPRNFTRRGEDVYASVEWEFRDARIEDDSGGVVFEQSGVEVPANWSNLATNIVASKYFRGHMDSPRREFSVRQLVGRVVSTLRDWGVRGNYFSSEEQGQTFSDELTHLLVHQKACFNSPVWFNLGVVEDDGRMVPQQASACFIKYE